MQRKSWILARLCVRSKLIEIEDAEFCYYYSFDSFVLSLMMTFFLFVMWHILWKFTSLTGVQATTLNFMATINIHEH